jgi:acetolactate synthase-1/3 small subunit
MLKQDFTLELSSDNNFSVLNRIINILNRRRVRIRKMMVFENEDDFRRGGVIMLLYTTQDMMEKVKVQLEKLIETNEVNYFEGSASYLELSERIVDVD